MKALGDELRMRGRRYVPIGEFGKEEQEEKEKKGGTRCRDHPPCRVGVASDALALFLCGTGIR